MQKVEDEDGTPIVTDDTHIVAAWVVIGSIVLGIVLLVGVWLFKN